ncbi:ABC transporter ATP-binding protein [Undibacterium sp. Ren11W]|uniref:ABC transporter ATP-binding protein n=1 Tax=Undibacterium sp. Ren11W TaxID=3413045 RepID=UPI003BF05D37
MTPPSTQSNFDANIDTMIESKNVIEIRQICTRFGEHIVHENLDLEIRRGEIFAIVGGSGSGKSTLLREMIMLHRPDSGSIKILGADIFALSADEEILLRQRWGVMFQHGGLFGTLNVRDNIALPLNEHTDLDATLIDEVAAWKLTLSGLAAETGLQFPTELSGGMLKRASMARALALDPELLFLDEPTAGLDPSGAAGIDALVRTLHELYQSTIVIITHDLDFLWQVTDRVAVLGEGKVIGIGSMTELSTMEHPIIREYFDGPRGRAARTQALEKIEVQTQIQQPDQEPMWTQK